MKKLLACLLTVCIVFVLSVPVMAEENTLENRVQILENLFGGLSLYGSARYDTFYLKSNSKFTTAGDTDSVTQLVSKTPILTGPDQKELQYGLAGNSRIGIVMNRGEGLGGNVELAFKNDGSVTLRKGYGTYTFDGVTLLIGQDYTPLSDFAYSPKSTWNYSNQVFNGDNDMAGWGIIDDQDKRVPQIKVKWNGLQVALVEDRYASFPAGLKTTPTDATTQDVLPKLEARYRLTTDMCFGDIFGGVNSYKVKSETDDIDKTLTSYALGVGGGINLDPAYVRGMVWTARNGKQMGLHQADAAGVTFNSIPSTNNPTIADDDLGWAIIAGVNIQKVTVEAGYGFVSSKMDESGAKKNEAQNYYLNATIPVIQNAAKTASFMIVPEVGVYDYMKNASGTDQGKALYAGAKWQVDF
ncbi:MAG: hypothetical protein ABSA71_10440 [Desulfomonilia bacterium]|jgi:hypothetical protein